MSDENTVLSQYVPGYVANLNLAPQQTMSKLIGAVDSELSYSTPGQLFNADDVGVTDPEDVQTRVADTPDKFIDAARRVGYFREFHDSAWFDNVDQVKMITDPTSAKMQALMAGMGRKRDTTILAGMLGAAFAMTDDSGAPSTIAWPTSQLVASNDVTFAHQDENVPTNSSDYGMSVGKLIHANLLLDDSELEGERFCAFGPAQKADLLRTTPITSQWYNNVQALVEGKVNQLLGITFVPLPRARLALKPSTSNVRRCPVWIKSAVIYKGRTITNASIRIRHDKSDTPQAYYKASHGVARRYDKGVAAIDCLENG